MHHRLRTRLLGFAILGCSFPGCLDLTPVGSTYQSLADAAPTGADASTSSGRCERCFYGHVDSGVTCKDVEDTCNTTATCPKIVRCMLEVGCYDGPGGEAANRCGVNCVLGAGVTSPDDPGLAAAVSMANCSHQKCPALCFPDSPDGAF